MAATKKTATKKTSTKKTATKKTSTKKTATKKTSTKKTATKKTVTKKTATPLVTVGGKIAGMYETVLNFDHIGLTYGVLSKTKEKKMRDLCDQLQGSINLYRQAGLETYNHYVRCGHLFIKIKELVGHGHWLEVCNVINISDRMASNMMRVARAGYDGEMLMQRGGIDKALLELREQEKDKKDDTKTVDIFTGDQPTHPTQPTQPVKPPQDESNDDFLDWEQEVIKRSDRLDEITVYKHFNVNPANVAGDRLIDTLRVIVQYSLQTTNYKEHDMLFDLFKFRQTLTVEKDRDALLDFAAMFMSIPVCWDKVVDQSEKST